MSFLTTKKIVTFAIIVIAGTATMTIGQNAYAFTDSDGDTLEDSVEVTKYHTDPYNFDHDGDGFGDGEEINNGFSPHAKAKTRLAQYDYDKDGLNDALELAFGTDLGNIDSDKDGISDGQEVKIGRDPGISGPGKLIKRIEVSLKQQKLRYYLGSVAIGELKVSTGKASSPTPKGNFSVVNKIPRAWSRPAQLWMPYWMAFVPSGRYGLHELPEWPNGRKEGQNHLGIAVSGGCIRLGINDAKMLYEWTPIGTIVAIKD